MICVGIVFPGAEHAMRLHSCLATYQVMAGDLSLHLASTLMPSHDDAFCRYQVCVLCDWGLSEQGTTGPAQGMRSRLGLYAALQAYFACNGRLHCTLHHTAAH